MKSPQVEIVGGIHDYGEIASRKGGLKASGELRATNSTRQSEGFHGLASRVLVEEVKMLS